MVLYPILLSQSWSTTLPNFMLVSGIAQSGQNLALSRLAKSSRTEIHHFIEILTVNPLKYKMGCINMYGIIHLNEKSFKKILHILKKSKLVLILFLAQMTHTANSNTPVCYSCGLNIFRDLAFQYRKTIKKEDLPGNLIHLLL